MLSSHGPEFNVGTSVCVCGAGGGMLMCGRDSSRNDEPTEYVVCVGRICEWNTNCHTM